MTLTVSHQFVSAKPDPADTSLIKPSDWNADHSLSGQVPLANGGTAANLADPNADRILFWDDSAGGVTWLTAGTGLSISGTTITATSGTGDVVGPASSVDNEIVLFDSTTGKLIKRATTTGMVKATSGVISAGTDGTDYLSSTTGVKQGLHTIWIPAVAMVSRTTNGAASGTVETTTNKVMIKSLDFDASTIEYAQFQIRMPKSWNESTITFAPTWSHGSTTTNFGVSWGLQGVAISNDDAIDVAFGTAQYSNDTGGTTDDCYIGPTSSAITIAGTPQAEDWVVFQVLRKADDGTNDTLAIDARLLGVTIYYSIDAATDA